jgi:hypothetical protein
MEELAEEIDACITEHVFLSRQTLLEGYHHVGKLILEARASKKLDTIALYAPVRAKTLFYCTELAKRYPDLNSLPDGKNVSWHKIMKELPPYEE